MRKFVLRAGVRAAYSDEQKSPLLEDEWTHRHDLYTRAGIEDVWLIHHSRVTVLDNDDLATSYRDVEIPAEFAAQGGVQRRCRFRALESTLLRHFGWFATIDADTHASDPVIEFLTGKPPGETKARGTFYVVVISARLSELRLLPRGFLTPNFSDAFADIERRLEHERQRRAEAERLRELQYQEAQAVAKKKAEEHQRRRQAKYLTHNAPWRDHFDRLLASRRLLLRSEMRLG